MAVIRIPMNGFEVEFDSDAIVSWEMPQDIIDTGYSPEGYATRKVGEFTHLHLTFKTKDRPMWVDPHAD